MVFALLPFQLNFPMLRGKHGWHLHVISLEPQDCYMTNNSRYVLIRDAMFHTIRCLEQHSLNNEHLDRNSYAMRKRDCSFCMLHLSERGRDLIFPRTILVIQENQY